MTQFDFGNIDEANTSGTQLGLLLEQARDANHSLQRGPIRPTYAVQGMIWINDSVNPWIINFFDGVNDLKLGEIDSVLHTLKLFDNNIALATVATSADYNDLINRPNVNSVKVSANDTNPAKLEQKILSGLGLIWSTQNDGAAETFTINHDFSTQLEAEAGIISTKPMNPLNTKQAIKNDLGVDTFFEITSLVITGGLMIQPHGLGVTPKKVEAIITCITNDQGYVVGDEVPLTTFGAASSGNRTLFYNATDIKFIAVNDIIGSPSGTFITWNKANWNLTLRAWV